MEATQVAVEGKRVVVNSIVVVNCRDCPHFYIGFLSEPSECEFMKEVYTWFVPKEGIPKWCPMPDVTLLVKKSK